MDILFEIDMIYTKKLLTEAMKFHYRKHRKSLRAISLILAFCALFIVYAMIVGDGPIYALILFSLFTLVFIFVYFNGHWLSVNQVNKSFFNLNPSGKVKYIFYDDRFDLITSQKKATFSYPQIIYAIETNRLFVFAFSKVEIEFIDKSGFTRGRSKDFSGFITEKTNRRFILK